MPSMKQARAETHANVARTIQRNYITDTRHEIAGIEERISQHQLQIKLLKSRMIGLKADEDVQRQSRNEHIRTALKNGFGIRALAAHLGMSPGAVSDINQGRR